MNEYNYNVKITL